MSAEQMETKHKSRQEELLEDDFFARNALILIEEMVELNSHTSASEHTSLLVDEILHSVFFLGKIRRLPITPKDILSDEDIYKELEGDYPLAFDLYTSQLPKRSPFSCVLDMIVHLEGQENEDVIKKRLQQVILKMREGNTNELVSSTICISQNTNIPNSVRYYGVSMSTSGPNPGKIMVAASCFSIWDDYVAGAVMTYYPKKVKKSYFDGTINLPNYVTCQAFNLSTAEPKHPCISCGNLFGLMTAKGKEWAYGNCAEAESLSNLLKREGNVKAQARPTSETWTDENRLITKKCVLKDLRDVLCMLKFNWDNNFYTPQRGNIEDLRN